MSEAKHIFLDGRVQGVSLRWFTRKKAEELGLFGTVRNLHDGRVEVKAVGDADAIETLRKAIEEGPPMARVESVEVNDLSEDDRAEIENSEQFEILL